MTKSKISLPAIKLLLIPSIVIILIIISFVIDFFRHQTSKGINQNKTENIENYLSRPTATPTLAIDKYTVYDLNVKLKTENDFDFFHFIQSVNQTIRTFETTNYTYTDSFRVYSSPQTTNSNHKYLLMTLKTVDVKNSYENDDYLITLTPNNSVDINYLYDNHYCKTNNDCLIKNYICNYGAFNKYERIKTPYGCEGNTYDFQEDYYFGPYDEVLGCNSQTVYQGTKCINHQCTGQNRTIKCIGKLKQHP